MHKRILRFIGITQACTNQLQPDTVNTTSTFVSDIFNCNIQYLYLFTYSMLVLVAYMHHVPMLNISASFAMPQLMTIYIVCQV